MVRKSSRKNIAEEFSWIFQASSFVRKGDVSKLKILLEMVGGLLMLSQKPGESPARTESTGSHWVKQEQFWKSETSVSWD